MTCPRCNSYNLSCIESRPTGQKIRRRKKCLDCDYRMTTYEISSREYDVLKRYRELLEDMQAKVGGLLAMTEYEEESA